MQLTDNDALCLSLFTCFRLWWGFCDILVHGGADGGREALPWWCVASLHQTDCSDWGQGWCIFHFQPGSQWWAWDSFLFLQFLIFGRVGQMCVCVCVCVCGGWGGGGGVICFLHQQMAFKGASPLKMCFIQEGWSCSKSWKRLKQKLEFRD